MFFPFSLSFYLSFFVGFNCSTFFFVFGFPFHPYVSFRNLFCVIIFLCSVCYQCYLPLFCVLSVLSSFVLCVISVIFLCSVFYPIYLPLLCLWSEFSSFVLFVISVIFRCSVWYVCYLPLFCERPRFESWYVPFRDNYYKGKPDHAAAISLYRNAVPPFYVANWRQTY